MSNPTLRERMIRMQERSLGLSEGQHLSIEDLEKLIAQGQQFLDDCGPFDPAYEHLNQLNYRYKQLRFQLQCQTYGLNEKLQASMTQILRNDFLKLFDLTEDQLLEKACECEKPLNDPKASKMRREMAKQARDAVLTFIEWRNVKCQAHNTRQ